MTEGGREGGRECRESVGMKKGVGMTEGGREGGRECRESVGMKKGVGMTEGEGGVEERQRRGVCDRGAAWLVCRLAASHPPPNLPPGRGEG